MLLLVVVLVVGCCGFVAVRKMKNKKKRRGRERERERSDTTRRRGRESKNICLFLYQFASHKRRKEGRE